MAELTHEDLEELLEGGMNADLESCVKCDLKPNYFAISTDQGHGDLPKDTQNRRDL